MDTCPSSSRAARALNDFYSQYQDVALRQASMGDTSMLQQLSTRRSALASQKLATHLPASPGLHIVRQLFTGDFSTPNRATATVAEAPSVERAYPDWSIATKFTREDARNAERRAEAAKRAVDASMARRAPTPMPSARPFDRRYSSGSSSSGSCSSLLGRLYSPGMTAMLCRYNPPQKPDLAAPMPFGLSAPGLVQSGAGIRRSASSGSCSSIESLLNSPSTKALLDKYASTLSPLAQPTEPKAAAAGVGAAGDYGEAAGGAAGGAAGSAASEAAAPVSPAFRIPGPTLAAAIPEAGDPSNPVDLFGYGQLKSSEVEPCRDCMGQCVCSECYCDAVED